MEMAQEVPAFQRKVGSDKHFASGGWAQNGAIVADAERDCLAAGGEVAANLLDQT
jgi:hypothetical protein